MENETESAYESDYVDEDERPTGNVKQQLD